MKNRENQTITELKDKVTQLESKLNEYQNIEQELNDSNVELQKFNQKLKENGRQIAHFSSILESIRQVNRLISKEKDIKKLSESTCKILTESQGYFNSWIALLSENKKLDSFYHSNLEVECDEMKSRFTREDHVYCVNRIFANENVVFIKNPQNHCKGCPILNKHVNNVGMSAQISYNERLYGILTVSIPRELSDKERDSKLLMEVAGDLGQAFYSIESEKESKQLNDILQTLTQPLALLNKDYQYVTVNDVYAKLYGKAINEIIGRKVDDFVDQSIFLNEIKPKMDKSLKGEIVSYELKLSFDALGDRWMYMQYFPQLNDEKEIEGIISHGFDITDRKAYEERIRENEQNLKIAQERFQKAQHIGKVGNWEYDIITTHFWGSDEAKRMYGFNIDSEAFTTDEVENCIPERKRVHQALVDLIESDKPYDIVFDIITREEGIKRTIHSIASIERDENGNPLKVTGVVQDITRQKKAENALKASEERFKKLSDLTFEGILIHDNGITLDVNEALMKMFGYTREEVIGKNMLELAVPKEYHSKIYELIASERVAPYEIEAVKKDGTKIPIEITAKAVKSDHESFRVASIRDITERKAAEAELQKHRMHLEELVKERTKELEEKNEELERFNNLFVGREFRIKELKDKVKELEKKLGETDEI